MTTKTDATTTDPDDRGQDIATSNGTARAAAIRPLTIMLRDDVLKKLKIVAIVRETSVSELVADAATAIVRRELKKALAKISGE